MPTTPMSTFTVVCCQPIPASLASVQTFYTGTRIALANPALLILAFGTVQAALRGSKMLREEAPEAAIAIHTGIGSLRSLSSVHLVVQRAQALLAVTPAGGSLLSQATVDGLDEAGRASQPLEEIGAYRLFDLLAPINLYSLGPVPDPPIGNTLDSYHHNLPIQVTPFVGRTEDIHELVRTIRDAHQRLVTILGPSGTGKSRLALQTATQLVDYFVDGVFFVALAPVTEPTVVLSMIAQVLGVSETGDLPLLETVITTLRERHSLLVLDNVEQVLAVAPALRRLLSEAPQLSLLLTSQLALHEQGEHVHRLVPFAIPGARDRLDLASLQHVPAVALFVATAQSVDPTWSLTAANAAAVADLCSHLGGLPLAIELAAAHSDSFAADALLLMLRSRMAWIQRKRQNPTEADILRHILDWSYERLSPQQQRLYTRLGVFAGGCTLEALQEVANAADDLDLDVLDTMDTLVTRHLVLTEELFESELRYIWLDTIAEDMQRRLKRLPEKDSLHAQHAAHYIEIVESADEAVRGPQQAAWLARIVGEDHNMRQALSWLIEQHEWNQAARLASALGTFWTTRGIWAEGRRWLEQVAEQLAQITPALQAKVLRRLGVIVHRQGQIAEAAASWERSLGLYQQLGDHEGQIALQNNLAVIALNHSQAARAQEYLLASLQAARELGNDWWSALILTNLGMAYKHLGRYDEAQIAYNQSLDIRRALGDQVGVASCLVHLGDLLTATDQPVQAEQLLNEAITLSRQLSNQRALASALSAWGIVAVAQGNLSGAWQALYESMSVRQQIGDLTGFIENLHLAAHLLHAQGQVVQAVQHLSLAESARSRFGLGPSPLDPSKDRLISNLRHHLDATIWQTAWDEGSNLDFEQTLGAIHQQAARSTEKA